MPLPTCLLHTEEASLYGISFIAERQAEKLWIPIFVIFWFDRPNTEPKFTFCSSRQLFHLIADHHNLKSKP